MLEKRNIGIGMLGLGVVGGGVAKALLETKEVLAEVGYPLTLKRILVHDPVKPRRVEVNPSLITIDAKQIIDDPEIDIIVEVMGGETPALEYIKQALQNHKYVVTANKEVMAKYGAELLEIAWEKGVFSVEPFHF